MVTETEGREKYVGSIKRQRVGKKNRINLAINVGLLHIVVLQYCQVCIAQAASNHTESSLKFMPEIINNYSSSLDGSAYCFQMSMKKKAFRKTLATM